MTTSANTTTNVADGNTDGNTDDNTDGDTDDNTDGNTDGNTADSITNDATSHSLDSYYRHSAYPPLPIDNDGAGNDMLSPFDLPNEEFPVYGHRRGIMMVHDKFRCGPMAALVMRGYIHLGHEESAKLHSASLETTAVTAEWLRGIFLAEECEKDAYVFCYDGARRRMNQVKGEAAVYKYRTHTIQSGQYLYDASDTDRYPNGLVNTQPHSSHITPYTASWGKAKQLRQKNAPKPTNRNLFLSDKYPAGTLITVNFGHDYNTEGFVRLVCAPNDQRADRGTAHNAGRKYGGEVVGEDISVYWPLDQTWYEASIKSYDHTGRHVVEYRDGMLESCHLHKQTFKWKGGEKVQKRLDKEEIMRLKATANGVEQGMTMVGGTKVKHSKKRKNSSNQNLPGGIKKFKSNQMNVSSSSSSSSNASSVVRPWTSSQSKKKLQPLLDRLLEMRWEIPVDVTGGDARIEMLEALEDRVQLAAFNPFHYDVTKEKVGSDGVTKKSQETQDLVATNVARIEKEGKLINVPKGKGGSGGRRKKGKGKNPARIFRLPSYFEIVHKPMSLQKIQRKLGAATSANSNVAYPTYDTFLGDIRLIANNAKAYYSDKNNAIHVAAIQFWRETQRLVGLARDGKLRKGKRKSASTKIPVKVAKKKKKTAVVRETTGRVRKGVNRMVPGG